VHVRRLPAAWLLHGDATNNVAKVRQTIWLPTPQVVAQAWGAWQAEVDFGTRFVAEASSLDVTANDPLNQHGSGGGPMSLREVLLGMIEEYARHMGHADLLRERIDGRLGQ